MKNIHVLPTPKPSRFTFIKYYSYYRFREDEFINDDAHQNQHIYITSDEALPYDSSIFDSGAFYHIDPVGDVHIITKHTFKPNPHFCKRIILTTDQDLIKDGVQAIDDEFLEWFVKNPSCENIPIIMTTVSKESTYKTNIGFESWRKEEPSQDNRMYSEEEVLDILRKSHSIEQTSKMDSWITKWFEQFKKK